MSLREEIEKAKELAEIIKKGSDMSDTKIRFGTNQGWQCPKCGRVYAPWMSSCLYCGVDNNRNIH